MSIEPAELLSFVIVALLRLGGAALVLIFTRWVAGRIRRHLQPILDRAKLTPSLTVLTLTVVYYLTWIVGAMVALVVLGVAPNTVLLLGGGVLVVLGVALQQSLRDLAATVNFILFKHFEPGDYIETNGISGTVQEIELLNTAILCPDRKVAVLPNSKIQEQGLVNYSKENILRADMVFSISYEDDLPRAKTVIRELLSEDPRILADPRPMIIVLGLGDNGVQIGVRPFVKADDYWQVLWDITEAMKLRFDREDITIPYPQRDVHMNPASTAS